MEVLVGLGACAIDITNKEVDPDIEVFIEDQLATRIGFRKWKNLKGEITVALRKGAKGMYDALSSMFHSTNWRKVSLGGVPIRRARGLQNEK